MCSNFRLFSLYESLKCNPYYNCKRVLINKSALHRIQMLSVILTEIFHTFHEYIIIKALNYTSNKHHKKNVEIMKDETIHGGLFFEGLNDKLN